MSVSGSASFLGNLGEMMAHPLPHGRLPQSHPARSDFFLQEKCENVDFHTFLVENLAISPTQLAPRFFQSHPRKALSRGAGWQTEPLVSVSHMRRLSLPSVRERVVWPRSGTHFTHLLSHAMAATPVVSLANPRPAKVRFRVENGHIGAESRAENPRISPRKV
jgi:hypothetical protein